MINQKKYLQNSPKCLNNSVICPLLRSSLEKNPRMLKIAKVTQITFRKKSIIIQRGDKRSDPKQEYPYKSEPSNIKISSKINRCH